MTRLTNRVTEKQFQQQVRELMRLLGWEEYHTWNSLHSTNGFPDILAMREKDRRIIVAELKSETGKVTEDQKRWLYLFGICGVPSYVWRPGDWDEIEKVIK